MTLHFLFIFLYVSEVPNIKFQPKLLNCLPLKNIMFSNESFDFKIRCCFVSMKQLEIKQIRVLRTI